MKRTRLRSKSLKRRKHQNPEVVAEYRRANPRCEVSTLLPVAYGHSSLPRENGASVLAPRNQASCDPHHITGGIHGTVRWDETCNLIMLSRTVHEWVEEYWADGLCLCLLAKMRKGEMDQERLEGMLSPVRDFSLREFVGSLEIRFDQFGSIRNQVVRGLN